MRKILYMVHQSLDGYIEGPEGEFDWPVMGPELSDFGQTLNAGVDTFLYGRVVWEMMAGYWPIVETISTDPHDLRFAPVWRATRKVVVSATLERAEWGAEVIGANLAEDIAALKQEPGKDILLTGGAGLANALTGLGQIDEYLIFVHPVILGGGKPVFRADETRHPLALVESRTFDARTVLLRYERVGE
ncbi:dihydrofolate reductase family protein (plasmid) [Embleya sp. NBC_00888]|uniref:dihydrofolate reductase family protein n=1 Tax=Embleya sp. NBC_00888 TaxID=2975960 RepID=UPI002F90D046|nr:dihydrofolate reductase family protein [Embleya sp. NBC_00888]